MAIILDYKEKVKDLITDTYEEADLISFEFKYTTADITTLLQCILPDNAVDEHMVFEALTELGFKPKEEKPLHFMWYFRRK